MEILGPIFLKAQDVASVQLFASAQREVTMNCRHFDTYEGAPDARSVRQYEFVVRAVATLGEFAPLIS